MRKPRRRLAAPIVVTLAATAGCNQPDVIHVNPPPPEVFHPNPPAPDPQPPPDPQPSASAVAPVPTATFATPPPAPPTAKVATDLPPPSGRGHVMTRPDGTCVELADMHCSPGRTCNPPPPHPVRCPDK